MFNRYPKSLTNPADPQQIEIKIDQIPEFHTPLFK